MAILGNTTATQLDVANTITANKIVKLNGTSSQFLKADGSVDNNSYLTSTGTIDTAKKVPNSLTITNLNGEKKTFNGSVAVDVSSGVNLAAKANALSKSIKVSGGYDIPIEFSTDGSKDVTATIGFPIGQVSCEGSNSAKYKRFACLYVDNDSSVPKGEIDYISNDCCGLFFVGKDYTGSGSTNDSKTNTWGILRVVLRVQSDMRYLTASWVVRTFTDDLIFVQRYDNNSKVGVDLFAYTSGTWDNYTIRCINQGGRGVERKFRMLKSIDSSLTESYSDLATACTTIHGSGTTYAESIKPTDRGIVKVAKQLSTTCSMTTNLGSTTAGNYSGSQSSLTIGISGTLSVGHGGTGCTTLTSGNLLVGNGTGAITTRNIINNTSVGAFGWSSSTGNGIYIPTLNTLAYWNGAYTSTNSNLQYCDRGRFGTIIKTNLNSNASTYLNGSGSWTTPPNTWRTIKVGGTSIGTNELNLKGGTNISLSNSNGTVTVSATGLALSGHTHSYLPLNGGQLTGSLNFSTANAVIEWNTETYRQRIKTTDGSTSGTAVFTFQQSSNSGSSWTDLFTVKDDGTVVATTFSGNATSATVVKDANGTMKLYAEYNNEINFGGTNNSGIIYFGYQGKDSKAIPTDFYFGGATGTAKVHATNFYVLNKSTDSVLTSGGTKSWTTGATAKALVARDDNGYIYAKYVSTAISAEDSKEPTHFYYTYNSDNWIRKMTYNRLKTLLNSSLTVCEANLKWGGRDISGGMSPVDAAAMSCISANKAQFCNPDGVTIEYTTDGGTTWAAYPSITDAQKINLMSDIGQNFYIGGSASATVTTDCKLRITLNATSMGLYTLLKKILVNISTNGASNCSVIIESSNKGSETTWSTLRTSAISGYSNWNSLTFDKNFGGGNTATSNVANYRLTFQIGGINSGSAGNLYVINILLFGTTAWAYCSQMAKTGHLYSYDYNQNAYFPKMIYLNNSSSWGAVTATKNTYWSLRTPEGKDEWLCVPANGLLPSSANSSTGQSSLGTNSWYFKSAYIKNVYGTADVAKAAYIATGTTAHPAGNYNFVIESGTHTSSPNANTIYFVT